MVSPDGKWIAGSSGGGEGWLYPIDGGEARPIPGLQPGEIFGWTADARFLYAYQWKQSPIKIYRLNILSGQRRFFKEIMPPELSGSFDIDRVLFSSDGRYYAYGYARLLSEL